METTKSADGTPIAFDRVGTGPALVIVNGALSTRAAFTAPASLAREYTVVTYDRRGRGDSGDTEPHAVEREYEDLAAVVAAAAGSQPPFVFGHSSGGALALRAAAAGLPVAAVAAYEAPFPNDDAPSPGTDPRPELRRLVAAGRDRDAIKFWMTDVVRAPEQVTAQLDSAAWVTALEPLARTLPYDVALAREGLPADELPRITAPVLIMGGANSPAWFRRSVAEQAAAVPGAQLMMVEGYAHNVPTEVIAPLLADFFDAHR